MTNLMGQYDDYNRAHPNGTVKGYFEQIQWRPPIIAAGTSALAGVVIEICKTPKFAAIARLMRMTLKSASGYSTLRRRFLAIGCDDATWGKIVKFLGGACFPAKTPIYTIHGLKPIEAITVKDTVYSYDEAAQKYTLNKVKQTFKKTATQLVMLYALGGKLIASPTPEHPFFVKNTYKPAKELVKGDSLLSKNQGYVIIEKTVVVDSVLNVYNFEVENDHNYLVGEEEIVVHNTCFKDLVDRLGNTIRNISGTMDLGWFDEETLSIEISAILNNPTLPSGSTFDKLIEVAEQIANENKLKHVRIEFQLVVNTRLKYDAGWARQYGYYFSSHTDEWGTTVTWEKTL